MTTYHDIPIYADRNEEIQWHLQCISTYINIVYGVYMARVGAVGSFDVLVLIRPCGRDHISHLNSKMFTARILKTYHQTLLALLAFCDTR